MPKNFQVSQALIHPSEHSVCVHGVSGLNILRVSHAYHMLLICLHSKGKRMRIYLRLNLCYTS